MSFAQLYWKDLLRFDRTVISVIRQFSGQRGANRFGLLE